MDIRLGYSNNDEAHRIPKAWNLLTTSRVERPLVCEFPYEKSSENEEFHYNCEHLFLLQLGSVAHKYYLFNIRLPVKDDGSSKSPNMNIGRITHLELVVSLHGDICFLLFKPNVISAKFNKNVNLPTAHHADRRIHKGLG